MSDNQASPKIRKRRRRVWACSECRRRKLQCDRSVPACARCKRAGQAAKCHYVEAPDAQENSDGTAPAGSAHDAARLKRDADGVSHRVQSLETRLATLEYSNSRDPNIDSNTKDATALWSSNIVYDRAILSGNNFRTRFRGATSSGALMDKIQGFKQFTQDAFEAHPMLEQIRQHVERSEREIRLENDNNNQSLRAALMRLLPCRQETDRRVKLYMDTFDHIYHILHRPTFEEIYDKMWHDTESADPRHVVIVLIIVAIAHCSTRGSVKLFADIEGTARDEAAAIFGACSCWLMANTQRFDNVLDYQINFLLLVGRQLNDRKYKRTWANAGHTVRLCMCAGLHRTVDDSGGTTLLVREMRKRIWAAAAEFELQAAFEHGMCGHAWPGQSDVSPPSNLPDSGLEQATEQVPANVHTRTSYLAFAGESLQFRHSLNTTLNSTTIALSFHQVNEYADRIHTYIGTIPTHSGSEPILMKALLTIQLQQYLLILYSRHLEHTNSITERHFARGAVVDAAFQMLECHRAVIGRGIYLIEALYGDHVRVALSVCYSYTIADLGSDHLIVIAMEQHAFRIVSDFLALYTDKVQYFGGDRRSFWLMIAAMGLMNIKRDPASRSEYIRTAVENLAKPYGDLMASVHQGQKALMPGEEPNFSQPHQTSSDAYLPQLPNFTVDDLFTQWCDNMTDWDAADWLYDMNQLSMWDGRMI